MSYYPFLADGEKLDHIGLFNKSVKFAEDYREIKAHFDQHPSQDNRVKLCLNFIEKHHGPMLILENPGNNKYLADFQLRLFGDIPGRCFAKFTEFINNDPDTILTNNLLRV